MRKKHIPEGPIATIFDQNSFEGVRRAHIEALTLLKRYSINDAKYERCRRDFIYCVWGVGGGEYVLLNRDYAPIGMLPEGKNTQPDSHKKLTHLHVKLSQEFLQKFTSRESTVFEDVYHLFTDETNPLSSDRKTFLKYFQRLDAFFDEVDFSTQEQRYSKQVKDPLAIHTNCVNESSNLNKH